MTDKPVDASIDGSLDAILDKNEDVLLAAIAEDGSRMPWPASIDYPGVRPIPLTDKRNSMVNLAVAADRLIVVQVWEKARATGYAVGTIRCITDPDLRMTLTILNATERHGVWLALLTPDGEAVGKGPEVLPEMLVIPGRPRQATLYKSPLAVITAIDPEITGMLGWYADQMVGNRSTEFIHEDDQERAIENWMDMVSERCTQRVRLRHRCRDGSWLWLEVENVYHHDDDPEKVVVEAKFNDISNEMAAHEALRYREQLFSRLAESLPTGVVQVEVDGSVVFANQRLLSVFDTPEGDLTLDGLLAGISGDDHTMTRGALDRAFRQNQDAEFEVSVHRLGSDRQCAISVVAVTNLDGAPSALVCVSDITESARLREDLRVRATFDMLTGCHNRGSVMAHLDAALAKGSGSDTAVIFIDLDQFKPVNDRLGHAAGDEVLVLVADRLKEMSRAGDFVGRLGGDEFLLVCRDLADPAVQVAAIAERVHFALRHPMVLAAGTIEVGASIGVACSTAGMTGDALVSLADQAMYTAKEQGAGPVIHQAG
jgi:diguanylate cyclase (GGDEF)-like protein/PAS domain S-box-containing protein